MKEQITLFLQAALSVLKDPFFLQLQCTTLWNDISFDIGCLESYGSFDVPSHNATFDFAIDRFNAIFHTHLHLNTCALNYFLFKIGCKECPACFCGFYNESVKRFFLECPLYSAPRTNLLSLLLAHLLTGGLLCPKQKLYQFFCYFLQSKTVIYFFMSGLLYLIRRDFIKVLI